MDRKRGYWFRDPTSELRQILGGDHVSDEFITALLEDSILDDNKNETDTTVADELKEYERE